MRVQFLKGRFPRKEVGWISEKGLVLIDNS